MKQHQALDRGERVACAEIIYRREKRADEIQMAEIQTEAEEKKRADEIQAEEKRRVDEIQMANIEADKKSCPLRERGLRTT